jgi:predicted XRE-type DNA-binding protein
MVPRKRTTLMAIRHGLYVGLQSRVAKRLGINRSVVCRVMNGTATSARVLHALEKEYARIEREVERSIGRAA